MSDPGRLERRDVEEFNVLFVSARVDDMRLTAEAFRVYAHLARRANDARKCWPGVDSMAEHCRINRTTVIHAIKQLEARRMLSVARRNGVRTVYTLTPPSQWEALEDGGLPFPVPDGSAGGNGGGRSEGTPPVGEEEREPFPVPDGSAGGNGGGRSEGTPPVGLRERKDSESESNPIQNQIRNRARARGEESPPRRFSRPVEKLTADPLGKRLARWLGADVTAAEMQASGLNWLRVVRESAPTLEFLIETGERLPAEELPDGLARVKFLTLRLAQYGIWGSRVDKTTAAT